MYMQTKNVTRKFYPILTSFLSYLPSRFLVILNSIIIIPFFAYMLTTREMGVYQLAIGMLNLLCTCSTDWITKSALRFYEKYKIKNKLPEFYSNIIFISLSVYLLIVIFYFLSANYISTRYFISKDVLALLLVLIIPCGIRQFLYQMLRIFNKPFLYTFSIIMYQCAHLIFYLALFKIFGNVNAILASMTIGMVIIDIYIIKKIKFRSELKFKIEWDLFKEALQYSLPTIITNSGIWLLMHMNQFTFQRLEMFNLTASSGIAWVYTTYILTPLLSTFLFAVFPIIIKRHEHNQNVKEITTNTIKLYCTLFIPLLSIFIFYSREIASTVFNLKYEQTYIILPFFALTIFLHQLMKILNIKYHLENKTYIEMLITNLGIVLCIILTLKLIPVYHLAGAGISMLISIIFLITLHSLVHFKSLDYINTKSIFKTVLLTLGTGILIYALIVICLGNVNGKFQIIKPLIFLPLYYYSLWQLKEKILN